MKLQIPRSNFTQQYGPDHEEFWFHCPGCESDHRVVTRWGKFANRVDPTWKFNRDMSAPTFQPSVLVHWADDDGQQRCHLYVVGGHIQYLSDCTHHLAGKTIEMQEVK